MQLQRKDYKEAYVWSSGQVLLGGPRYFRKQGILKPHKTCAKEHFNSIMLANRTEMYGGIFEHFEFNNVSVPFGILIRVIAVDKLSYIEIYAELWCIATNNIRTVQNAEW